MSEMAAEITESEFIPETESESPEGYAPETGPGESPEAFYSDAYGRDRRLQMLRARQLAQQRRQPAPARPQAPARQRMAGVTGPSASQIRDIQTDVIAIDLDTKASLSRLRRDLDAADQLAYRNAVAAEASAASALVIDTWGDALKNYDWARALIIGAPTLLLKPRRKRKPGLEGIIEDPRFYGAFGLGIIAVVGHWTKGSRESRGVHSVQLSGPSQLPYVDSATLYAVALDARGNPVTGIPIAFSGDNDDVATVTPAGKLQGVATGIVAVTATATISASFTVTSLPLYITIT